MTTLELPPPRTLPFHALLFFASITFAITWGIIGGYIFFPDRAATTFGEISGSHARALRRVVDKCTRHQRRGRPEPEE
jgi:hypothetical protein